MYCKHKSKMLPVLAVALGLVTMALRSGLYLSGRDEKNLLVPGHILSYCVWGSVLVAAVVLGLGIVRKFREQPLTERAGIGGAMGDLALCTAVGFSVFTQGIPFTAVEKISSIVGVVCVPALLVAAVSRFRGKHPFFACNVCVCVYFCLHLIACYGSWSANPQLQDYVLSMLACVALSLFAYQQAAADVQLGNSQVQYVLGLLAGYLTIAGLYGVEKPWLYLAAGFWALTNLSSSPVPVDVLPTEEET